MKEFIDVFSSIGGKITISMGGLIALIFGIFKINTEVDKRIDKRSNKVVGDVIQKQERICHGYIKNKVKEGIEESPTLARIDERIKAMYDKQNGE